MSNLRAEPANAGWEFQEIVTSLRSARPRDRTHLEEAMDQNTIHRLRSVAVLLRTHRVHHLEADGI